VVAVPVLGAEPATSRLRPTAREHALLLGAAGAGLLVAGAAALAGHGVYSVFGRYAEAARSDLPNLWHYLHVLVQHFAELDLAVGVLPFVAAIACAFAFVRAGRRSELLPFAAVAVSVTAWLLAEVALDAAIFDAGADLPRIHERFLIYVTPFFLVTLLAAVRLPETRAVRRAFAAAAAFAAVLPLAIPFHTVVNGTIIADSFALAPFAHAPSGRLSAVPHAAVWAVVAAMILAALYLTERRRVRGTVLLALVPFLVTSVLVLGRVASASQNGRSFLPARTDWVDAAKPAGPVVLLSGSGSPAAARETAYSNLSIDRLFYLCKRIAGSEFGERQATVDPSGALSGPSGPIEAAYAVVPAGLGIQGHVVARNLNGRELLVALPDGRLGVTPTRREIALRCDPEAGG
jgi:hypothetical protein